jgi:hypothetical protein
MDHTGMKIAGLQGLLINIFVPTCLILVPYSFVALLILQLYRNFAAVIPTPYGPDTMACSPPAAGILFQLGNDMNFSGLAYHKIQKKPAIFY